MNQWGETGLVVVSADVLVFPVLGLSGVFDALISGKQLSIELSEDFLLKVK